MDEMNYLKVIQNPRAKIPRKYPVVLILIPVYVRQMDRQKVYYYIVI